MLLRGLLLLPLLLLAPSAARAQVSDCTFEVDGTTLRLTADCSTQTPIVIPDGFTLDGAHHTIRAVDPADAPFTGGVVVNGGRSASIVDTVITAALGPAACPAAGDRLRGIYFEQASGTIAGNVITGVHRPGSACPEGHGIEVRNAVLTGDATAVDIAGNVVDGYQRTGILASGRVDVLIHDNTVGTSATAAVGPSNAMQIGAGALAIVESNHVAGSSWGGADAAGTGILLLSCVPGTIVRSNVVAGRLDVGIYLRADGVTVAGNTVADESPDGYYDVGIGNYGDGNVITGNRVRGFARGYDGASEADAGRQTIARR